MVVTGLPHGPYYDRGTDFSKKCWGTLRNRLLGSFLEGTLHVWESHSKDVWGGGEGRGGQGVKRERDYFFPSQSDFIIFSFLNHFLLLFEYSCLHFPTNIFLCPTLNPTPFWLCPPVLDTCSLKILSLLSLVISLPHTLCLSVCSLFQCLWLNCAPPCS